MNTFKILVLTSLCFFNLSCNRLFDINYSKSKNSTIAPKSALLESWENTLPPALKSATGRMDVKVSLADNDEAIIVWADISAAPDTSIYKSEYRNGSWQHPSSATDRINAQVAGVAYVADLAFSKNGDAVLVWLENSNEFYRWHYRNGTWGTKELLATVPGNPSPFPQPAVKLNDTGLGLVVWSDFTGVFASNFDGSSWSAATELKAVDNSSFINIPNISLGIASSGDAVVAFSGNTLGGVERLLYRAHFVAATWVTPLDLNDTLTASGRDTLDPVVAISPSGRAVVYWLEATMMSESYLYTQVYDGVAWGAKNLLVSDLTSPLDVEKVSINDLGNVAISYFSQAALSIHLKFYNGSSWSGAIDSGEPDIYFLTAQGSEGEAFFLTSTESVVRKICSSSGCNTGSTLIASKGGAPGVNTFIKPTVVKNSKRTIYVWYYPSDDSTRGLEVYSGKTYLIDPIIAF